MGSTLILELAIQLTEDDDCAVHASIAGGRKTMSYYLGYVMSLVGRVQDRLSHVLVNEPFEFNAGFYYPTRQPTVLPTRGGEVDASQAQVALAAIPFVALNQRLPKTFVKRFRNEGGLFSQAVITAQISVERPRLFIDLRYDARDAFVGRKTPVPLNLAPGALVLYTLAAARRLASGGDASTSLFRRNDLPLRALADIRECAALDSRDEGGYDVVILQLENQSSGIAREEEHQTYYDRYANKIKTALDAISPFATDTYGLATPGTGLRGLLGLQPEDIEIRWPDDNELDIGQLDFD